MKDEHRHKRPLSSCLRSSFILPPSSLEKTPVDSSPGSRAARLRRGASLRRGVVLRLLGLWFGLLFLLDWGGAVAALFLFVLLCLVLVAARLDLLLALLAALADVHRVRL